MSTQPITDGRSGRSSSRRSRPPLRNERTIHGSVLRIHTESSIIRWVEQSIQGSRSRRQHSFSPGRDSDAKDAECSTQSSGARTGIVRTWSGPQGVLSMMREKIRTGPHWFFSSPPEGSSRPGSGRQPAASASRSPRGADAAHARREFRDSGRSSSNGRAWRGSRLGLWQISSAGVPGSAGSQTTRTREPP